MTIAMPDVLELRYTFPRRLSTAVPNILTCPMSCYTGVSVSSWRSHQYLAHVAQDGRRKDSGDKVTLLSYQVEGVPSRLSHFRRWNAIMRQHGRFQLMETDGKDRGPQRFSLEEEFEHRIPLTTFERSAQAMNFRQENLYHKESRLLDKQKLRLKKERDRQVGKLENLSSQLKARRKQRRPIRRYRSHISEWKPLESVPSDTKDDGKGLTSISAAWLKPTATRYPTTQAGSSDDDRAQNLETCRIKSQRTLEVLKSPSHHQRTKRKKTLGTMLPPVSQSNRMVSNCESAIQGSKPSLSSSREFLTILNPLNPIPLHGPMGTFSNGSRQSTEPSGDRTRVAEGQYSQGRLRNSDGSMNFPPIK